MSNTHFLNLFFCVDCHFRIHHTTGSLNYYEHPCIGYLLVGEGEFLFEGKKFKATAGDLIYIGKGTRYYSVWSGNPEIHYYSIDFGFSKPNETDHYPFQIIKNVDRTKLDAVIKNFSLNPFESIGNLYSFLNDLYPSLQKNEKNQQTEIILPALAILDTHYTEKIKIDDLAKACHLSQSHFFALFKKIMGTTPIEYKNTLLIQKGLDLLAHTNKSVEEISFDLGFSYPSYFRKLLKNATGKSPARLRNKPINKYE